MPQHGQWWKGPFNYWEQKAYLVLGADIILPADATFNNRYAYANDGETVVANGGLIGGFDGRGYTISGGTYNWGGLLGNIPAGSIVKNSVIFNDVKIGENCKIENAIIDKDTIIGKNSIIGHGDDLTPNKDNPKVLSSGINVIGKNLTLPNNLIVERNVRIFSAPKQKEVRTTHIKSGETIK